MLRLRLTKWMFVVVSSFLLIVVTTHPSHLSKDNTRFHQKTKTNLNLCYKCEQIAVALSRVFNYILENYQRINLDGLFGVVFAQAHLDAILKLGLPPKEKFIIEGLKKQAEFIYSSIKPILYKNGGELQKIFVDEILDPEIWQKKINFDIGELQPSPPINSSHSLETYNGYLSYLSSANLSETQSDQCLLELIQNGPRNVYHKCSPSDICRRNMLDDLNFDPAYGITHRLLYLQISHGRKCAMNLKSYREQTRSYCSYILWEATRNAQFGFLEELNDILLEQITLCGFEGYAEFLTSEFIDHVLDIQTKHGCFGILMPKAKNSKIRQRRSANLISYGCNDHTTGLGASTLALMLRYLLQK